jgi:hypothetical protein
MSYNKLKTFTVFQENYFHLKNLGDAGDGFIDLVKKLIAELGGKYYTTGFGSGSAAKDDNQSTNFLAAGQIEYERR